MRRLLLGLLLMAPALGCGGIITKQTRAQVDPNLSSAAAMAAPDQHKGKIILIGGRVLSLEHLHGQTMIEMAEIPLHAGGHPVLGAPPGNHYFLVIPFEEDGLRFKYGKLVTAAAEVLGETQPEVGVYMSRAGRLPIFEVKEAHVWDKVRKTRFLPFGARGF